MDNVMDFDTDGEWSAQHLEGPAIHAPEYIKRIVVNDYRCEWLDMSDQAANYYAKNHVVATVIFAINRS